MRELRPHGAEQPYIPAGPFKIRLPGIHYRWEWADYIQGLVMCAVCLSIIPVLQDVLGMPFEVALAIVVLNGLLYCLHVLLGDPVVPGWITPAIPLLIAYVSTFPEGPERVQALVAFEITLGLFAIFLGATGLAKKLISFVPQAIKSGVVMGAGFAAVYMIFQEGGRFEKFPWTISICIGLAFYLIFSQSYKVLGTKNRFFKLLGNLGILPSILLAIVVAPLVGETTWPTIEWGISKPDFIALWRDWTPFGAIGWPSISMFIAAIPTVFASYIVLFGDVVQSQALIKDADIVRDDEKIDYNPNRAHLVFGARNTLMGMFGPDISMCGPLWAAMQVVVCERYKQGRKAMDSLFGGAGCFRWGTLTGYFLLPIVTLTKPILPVALALTMLVQGFVSVRIGAMESRSFKDLGIAGVMGAVLMAKGAAYGFAVGILLCLLIYGKNFFKGDVESEPIWAEHIIKQQEEKEGEIRNLSGEGATA